MSELRRALRSLIKAPAPSLVVVLTLAVSIGAATIVYSTIDMVWYLMPIANRDGLVFLASVDARRGEMLRLGLSSPDLADIAAQSRTLAEVGGFSLGSASLTGVDVPTRVATAPMTANLPAMWGLTAQIGRLFRPDDGGIGSQGVIVLTDTFWRNQFAARADVIGRSVLLDGTPQTVIGVLPPQAAVGLFRQSDVLVPLPLHDARVARDQREILVTGRLARGASRDDARAEVDAIAERLRSSYPQTNAQVRIQVLPLIEMSGLNIQTLLFLLSLVAALVVAIACANVTNVVLAQATARAHEAAVRAALGASRFQQVRQTLLESLLMAGAACVAGLAVAAWGLAGLRRLAGDTLGFSDLALNGRVLTAGALTALLAAAFVGLLPALRPRAVNLQALKEGGRGRTSGASGRWIRTALVVSQVALAMILMVQIVVSVRGGRELYAVNNGFDPRAVLTLRIELPAREYPQGEASRQFFAGVLERLHQLPGVASAAMIDRLPVADDEARFPFAVEGGPARRPEELPLVARTAISPGFRSTMRIRLLAGRDLTEADSQDAAAVALVNEEAARRFWPGAEPIGTRVRFVLPDGPSPYLTIVGVVGNTRNADIDELRLAQVYVPSTLSPQRAMALVIRAADGSAPLSLVESVRKQVLNIDPRQPIYDVATMEQVIADDFAGGVVLATLLGAIGFVALCLAAAGIYGVVAYMVSQRTREIGVRIALGASPGRVHRLVFRQGTMPVVTGGVIGLIAAIFLTSATAGAISTSAPRDPLNYIAVVVTIGLVAMAALYLPAARASRVDPTIALRAE